MIYDIHAPWKTLDPWQKKYIATKGNCFVLCGRQSGKTAAASIKFGDRAAKNPKQIILMVAFTENQAYNLFFKTLMYLRAKYPDMIKRGRDAPTKHKITLKNGSIIMCYAVGLTGEGIRTYTVTSLVIDEAAPMAREVFIAVTPMLSVTGGTLDLMSTPRGKGGYFYECSDQCPNPKENFTRFYVSAEDCPRHSKEFLESERESMTKLEYRQEYEARFLDDLRRLFSDELIKKITTRKEEKVEGGKNYLGVDVARMNRDEFAYAIINKGIKMYKQVYNHMTRNVPIPKSTREIMRLNVIWKFKREYIDSGGMGIVVCDLLRESLLDKRKVVEINNASRVYARDSSKKDIVEKRKRVMKEEIYFNALRLMEQGKVELLDKDEIRRSLASIQIEQDGNKITIWGDYSHITEAIVRALWCSQDKSLNMYIIS